MNQTGFQEERRRQLEVKLSIEEQLRLKREEEEEQEWKRQEEEHREIDERRREAAKHIKRFTKRVQELHETSKIRCLMLNQSLCEVVICCTVYCFKDASF